MADASGKKLYAFADDTIAILSSIQPYAVDKAISTQAYQFMMRIPAAALITGDWSQIEYLSEVPSPSSPTLPSSKGKKASSVAWRKLPLIAPTAAADAPQPGSLHKLIPGIDDKWLSPVTSTKVVDRKASNPTATTTTTTMTTQVSPLFPPFRIFGPMLTESSLVFDPLSQRWQAVSLFMLQRSAQRCRSAKGFDLSGRAGVKFESSEWTCEPVARVDDYTFREGFFAYAAKLHPGLLVPKVVPRPSISSSSSSNAGTRRDIAPNVAATVTVNDQCGLPMVISYVANAARDTDALFLPDNFRQYTPRIVLVQPTALSSPAA